MLSVSELCFFAFSAGLLTCATTVVFSKHPMNAIMSLIFTFVLTACLWILAEAEFLGLLLIFVYVGAVMTLFLFVVMMLDLQSLPRKKLLYSNVILIGTPAATIIYQLYVNYRHIPQIVEQVQPSSGSNVHLIGLMLYQDYVFELQLCGLILLTAILGGVSLCHLNRSINPDIKRQSIEKQKNTSASSRVTLIDLEKGK